MYSVTFENPLCELGTEQAEPFDSMKTEGDMIILSKKGYALMVPKHRVYKIVKHDQERS